MNIPVEIYDENLPMWETSQEEEDYQKLQEKGNSEDTFKPRKNELLSGNYFVQQIEYIYHAGENPSYGQRIRQSLTLVAKIPEDELEKQQ